MARLPYRLAAGAVAAALGLLAWSSTAKADSLYPTAPVTLRSGPGFMFESLGIVSENVPTFVVETQNNWYHVKLTDGRDGWLPVSAARVVFDAPVTIEFPTDLETRTGPSWMSQVSGKVTAGSKLTSREATGGYYLVSVGGKNVYVDGSRANVQVPQAPPVVTDGQTARQVTDKLVTILSSGTALRNGRSTDYATVVTLGPGDSSGLKFLGALEGWVLVRTPSGKQGWINGQQVFLSDKSTFAKQVAYDIAEGRWIMAAKALVTVMPNDGLNLRQSAAATAPVLGVYGPGTQLRVLQSQGIWQRVQGPDGKLGWVDGTFTAAVQSAAPQVSRTTVKDVGSNVLQLEISGSFARASVGGSPAQKTLTIGIADPNALSGSLPLGDHGVAVLRQGTAGVTLAFDGTFGYKVLDNSPGHVLLELRPHVASVSSLKGADGRLIYRFAVNGESDAKVTRSGANVTVEFPGAVMDGAISVTDGMTVTQTATGVRAQIASLKPFELKRRGGQVDLVFFSPGLAGKTIVLDPGHGGVEPGAMGPGGSYEKNINLATAMVLRDLLTQAGAKVIMTRSADTRASAPAETAGMDAQAALRYDLNKRTVISNQAEADVFISIHANGGSSTARGTETFFYSGNFNGYSGQRLAGLVQNSLISSLGTRNMGVGDEDFYVVKYTDAPAILVEQEFLTTPSSEALLNTPAFRAKVANAILPALQKFFSPEF